MLLVVNKKVLVGLKLDSGPARMAQGTCTVLLSFGHVAEGEWGEVAVNFLHSAGGGLEDPLDRACLSVSAMLELSSLENR